LLVLCRVRMGGLSGKPMAKRNRNGCRSGKCLAHLIGTLGGEGGAQKAVIEKWRWEEVNEGNQKKKNNHAIEEGGRWIRADFWVRVLGGGEGGRHKEVNSRLRRKGGGKFPCGGREGRD